MSLFRMRFSFRSLTGGDYFWNASPRPVINQSAEQPVARMMDWRR